MDTNERPTVKFDQKAYRQEAIAYDALCDEARALGIDTEATDATSIDPNAIAKLRAAVEAAR